MKFTSEHIGKKLWFVDLPSVRNTGVEDVTLCVKPKRILKCDESMIPYRYYYGGPFDLMVVRGEGEMAVVDFCLDFGDELVGVFDRYDDALNYAIDARIEVLESQLYKLRNLRDNG